MWRGARGLVSAATAKGEEVIVSDDGLRVCKCLLFLLEVKDIA